MNKEQKYIARQAIFEALTGGRKLSQMNCKEFEVEDMRTPISHMKDRIDNAGFNLHTKWIQTPKGRRIKEYWLERRVQFKEKKWMDNSEFDYGHDVRYDYEDY